MGRARGAALRLLVAATVVNGCSSGGAGSGGRARPVVEAPRPGANPAARHDAGPSTGGLPSVFSRRRDAAVDAVYQRLVGIPECDEFLFKFQRCMDDKAPAAQRATLEATFETLREAWSRAAASANDQSRRALGAACKSTLVQVGRSLRSFGCSW